MSNKSKKSPVVTESKIGLRRNYLSRRAFIEEQKRTETKLYTRAVEQLTCDMLTGNPHIDFAPHNQPEPVMCLCWRIKGSDGEDDEFVAIGCIADLEFLLEDFYGYERSSKLMDDDDAVLSILLDAFNNTKLGKAGKA